MFYVLTNKKTYGVMLGRLGLELRTSPLAPASLFLSASSGGDGAPSHCDCSSGESHIESIMCNKLLLNSSYVWPIVLFIVVRFQFIFGIVSRRCTWRIQGEWNTGCHILLWLLTHRLRTFKHPISYLMWLPKWTNVNKSKWMNIGKHMTTVCKFARTHYDYLRWQIN